MNSARILETEQNPDVVPLAQLFHEFRHLDAEGFAAQHNHPFLVLDNMPLKRGMMFPAESTAGRAPTPTDLMRTQNTRRAKAGLERYAAVLKKTERNNETGVITLGRGRNNDVVIDDVTVSRAHAIFEFRDGAWWLTDLGSANHTRIDDRVVAPKQPSRIDDGCTLHLGEVLALFCLPQRFHRYATEFLDGAALNDPNQWTSRR